MMTNDDNAGPKENAAMYNRDNVEFHENHTPANSFPGENQRRLERSTRPSCRVELGVTGMLIGCEGFGDRRCQVAGVGEVVRRCGSATNVLAFVTPESDCEDSDEKDAATARGDRGNANLMELKRPPLLSFSSLDLFGDAGLEVADVDVFEEEEEESAKWAKVGAGGRSGGVIEACEGSIQKWVSGEMTMSSTSKSSSNVPRSVAIDR